MSYEDILNEGGSIQLMLHDYPVEDLRLIAEKLEKSISLVTGFISNQSGFLSVPDLIANQMIDKTEIVFLADRNIINRISRIAKTGILDINDQNSIISCQIMALAQIVDINFDPTIAMYELAHTQGSRTANKELAWFKLADKSSPYKWIDLALGRTNIFETGSSVEPVSYDLEKTLGRWERNYAIVLKIAELELSCLGPVEKFQSLLDWMKNDFFIAGPSLMFAAMYFSTKGRKRDMIKKLRSHDRMAAIEGISNAAWDITYLSYFNNMSKENDFEKRRYVFVTADKALAEIANNLMIDADEIELENELNRKLSLWWPENDSKVIVSSFYEALQLAGYREPPSADNELVDPIHLQITKGIGLIESYKFDVSN